MNYIEIQPPVPVDCFVDHYLDDETYLVTNDYTRRPNHEIYGAVWTDKGLIYVAKMNGKGEFELL